MLLSGEPVTVCRKTGGGTNDDGDLLPSVTTKTVVEGCVIQERTSSITTSIDKVTVAQGVTFLMPGVHDFPAAARDLWFVARGWEWNLDGEAFVTRSAFGTFLEWTEVPVKKVRVA
ncbi:MAG: hypothetical protein L0K73_09910 [Corynebacterium variabile]|uniref:hypothetical protein n=1 Tax=Corynebacterium variabile TaxID=1727 RepID=UPI0026473775|nr:hypothetical protein [Corynebacterium variabile]MDN6537103.1 hypothetical protein [Corynebacterium variabile]